MIKPGFSYFFYLNDNYKLMESIDSSSYPPINRLINGLTKKELQELCNEVIMQINRYDYLIQRQLEKTMKNYKLSIELCEEKLDLLSTYKQYKTVLATLSAGKKDLSTTKHTPGIMVSERDPHE